MKLSSRPEFWTVCRERIKLRPPFRGIQGSDEGLRHKTLRRRW